MGKNNEKGNCFICNREIVLGWECTMEGDQAKENPLEAVTSIVTGGYTSRFDCLYGRIFICDPCFMDRVERVMDVRDYFEEMADKLDEDGFYDEDDKVSKELCKLNHPSSKSVWDNLKGRFR